MVGYKRCFNGNPIVTYKKNPLFYSRVYTIKFYDDRLCGYSYNMIAENMYEQVDEEGWKNLMMSEIVEHWISEYKVRK